MNKKKVLLSVLAIVLICVISVTGTLAYLTLNTAAVTNTFVAAGGGQLIDETNGGKFVLDESLAVKKMETVNGEPVFLGQYELNTTAARVTSNSYDVLPGAVLPKDPAVTITQKTSVPAYLYVEIVDGTTGGIFSWTIADNWTKLDGVTGKNGGTVYVYNTVLTNTSCPTGSIPVLKDNKVTVANADDLQLGDAGKTISFYGYLAQATIGDVSTASGVYQAAFPTT